MSGGIVLSLVEQVDNLGINQHNVKQFTSA